MNPNQRNRVIALVAFGVPGAFLIWYNVFRETPEHRLYMEKQKNKPATAASVPGETPVSPAAGPAVASTAPAGGPARARFQKADVNIDELIAGIKEVDFDYDAVAMDTDPLTPLVGPFAPQHVATTDVPGAPSLAARQDVQMLVRNIHVTGIMWDKYDPMAVVVFPVQGEKTSEVVSRGYKFPDMDVSVHDIETDRIILNINGVLVPIELEER